MKKMHTVGRALAFSIFVALGIAVLSPTLHAAGGESLRVQCQLLQRAIAAATALYGADSPLVLYLQEQYTTYCGG